MIQYQPEEFFDAANIFVNDNQIKKTSMHAHNFIEIAYVYQGKGKHELNGHEVSCQAGDIFVIDKGCHHQFFSKGEILGICNCIFTPDFVHPILSQGGGFAEMLTGYLFGVELSCTEKDLSVPFHGEEEVELLFFQMLSEYQRKNIGYIQKLQAGILNLLVCLVRQLQERQEKQIPTKNPELRKIIEHICIHYNQEVSLKELSKLFGYNEEYLCRKFKKETGKNMKEFIRQLRMQEAKKLLIYTETQIKEISQMVGYRDGKYFAELFKLEEGVSPMEYRKRHFIKENIDDRNLF